MAVGLTTNLRHNTWTVGQWYDQTVADDSNVIDYEGERSMFGWGESASNKYAFHGPSSISETDQSSPVQTPGSIWKFVARAYADQNGTYMALKSNGKLYTWGANNQGNLGQNQSSSGAGSSTPICCRYSIAPDALRANSLFAAACAFNSLISPKRVCLCETKFFK